MPASRHACILHLCVGEALVSGNKASGLGKVVPFVGVSAKGVGLSASIAVYVGTADWSDSVSLQRIAWSLAFDSLMLLMVGF